MDRKLLVMFGVLGGTLGCARGVGTRAGAVPDLDRACDLLDPQAISGREVRRGQEAPDFELKDMMGKSWSLRALRGRPVLINFWASWCEPCRKEIPALETLARRSIDRVVVLLTVNVDEDADAARKFFPKGTTLTVLLDSQKQIAKRYGTEKFPESFLIDSRGRIQQLFHQAEWAGPAADACLPELH
jgi:peroxiredoxin